MLQAIYNSVLKLLLPLSPEETYRTIIDEANKLVGSAYGSIFLANGGKLERVFSSVPNDMQFQPRKNGYVHQVYKDLKPRIISAEQLKKERPDVNTESTKFFTYIPLQYDRKAIGVITLNSKKDTTFTNSEYDTLKVFGSIATLKIRNVQLLAQTQEALQTRDLFISMASHELKTPLTTILGYTQLLERQALKNERVPSEWIFSLKKETLRLNQLIKELLEVNSIKTGTLKSHFQRKGIKLIVQHAISDMGFIYPKHTVIFHDELKVTEKYLMLDEEKIIQMMINILSNAAKFSSPYNPISVTLKQVRQSICITISDQGDGIDEEDIPRVFEVLYRGKKTKKEGMGLGLFIVKSIVDAHRGKITVKSEKGKGTEFKISLPI